MTANSSVRLLLNASTITLYVCCITPTPIAQADKYWLVRACGAGLRKRLSYSATRTKHNQFLPLFENYMNATEKEFFSALQPELTLVGWITT